MQRVGVGTSTHRDAKTAARSAVRAALKQAERTSCDLVLAFATSGHDEPSLIKAISEAADGAPVAGCSGATVLGNDLTLDATHGVAVMVFGAGDAQLSWV